LDKFAGEYDHAVPEHQQNTDDGSQRGGDWHYGVRAAIQQHKKEAHPHSPSLYLRPNDYLRRMSVSDLPSIIVIDGSPIEAVSHYLRFSS
jgi:hypothetical protein